MAATSRGIDVSSYQDKQNWAALAKGGLSFAQIKASEGLRKDDAHYRMHMDGVRSVPSLLPGAYHYAWPNQDAAAEADHYVGIVRGDADNVLGFHHWLDLERSKTGENYAGVTSAGIRAYAEAWIEHVKTAFPRQRVGCYTSKSDIEAGHYPRNADALWYPAYPTGPLTYTQAEQRTKPNPGRPVLMWQFASKTRDGRSLDQSIAYLTPAALRTWAGATTTVQEDAMPEPKDLWAYKNATAAKKNPALPDAYGYLVQTATAVKTLTAQVTAQTAAITALAQQLGKGKDVATIVAAVQTAIKNEVVRVEITTEPDDEPSAPVQSS